MFFWLNPAQHLSQVLLEVHCCACQQRTRAHRHVRTKPCFLYVVRQFGLESSAIQIEFAYQKLEAKQTRYPENYKYSTTCTHIYGLFCGALFPVVAGR